MKTSNKALRQEVQTENLVSQYKDEAVKNTIVAFNEGYMLGRKHAENILGGENGGR